MKKVLVMLLLSTIVMTGTAFAAPDKKLAIGFTQIGAESAWRTAETNSMKDTAAERNIDFKFADAQQKQENQIAAVRSFIAQKVKGIIIAPVVETGWEPVLREAKKAGIPVVLVDRGIQVSDPSLYTTLIASDFIWEGAQCAKWLAKKTGGKCNIVELQGTVGASAAIDRQKGFADEIKKYPGLKIIKTQSGDFTRAGGQQVMEAFLKSDGDKIQAVYAHNDDMALGAIQAIEAAGKVPGKDILVMSIDGTHDGFQAMIDGKANLVVECNPLLGPAAFDAIARAIMGETLPKWIKQSDGVFPAETAADALPSRKY